MTKKDLKKIEHASERHKIAEDIVAIRNLKSFSQEKKDELIQGLLDKKELTQTPVEMACPFPQHKEYAKLRNNLEDKPKMQKQMKENIRISADGKIEIIKMKKKFSLLTAEHNGKDIFKGEHEDQYGRKGISGVTYLTGRAAEKACKEQNKKLLNDRAEVEQFISYFPGESTGDKIFNFFDLFDFKLAGYWSPTKERWYDIGSTFYVILSRVVGNSVYGAGYGVNFVSITQDDQSIPVPCVAYEDCAA